MALEQYRGQTLQLYENQNKAIKLLKKLNAPIGLGFFYEKYMENTYHFIRYDIKEHKNICIKIAIIFSKYPNIFLGTKRSEIQLDNDSVTLSCNDWIECKSLPLIEIDFTVEYYIHTLNNFPITIFFRINKNTDHYEENLMNFINYLIAVPLLINNKIEPQEIIIESEELKAITSHTINQKIEIQNMQLITIDDDMLGNAVFAFLIGAKKKQIYVIIMLYCGILASCTIVNFYTKHTNSSSYDH